ncbi:uncharacterized protein [Argopecten irradians]
MAYFNQHGHHIAAFILMFLVKEAECQTDTNTLIFAAVGGSAMVIGLILSFILYWYCHYHTRTEGGGFEIICPASIVRQFSIIAMPNVSQDVID